MFILAYTYIFSRIIQINFSKIIAHFFLHLKINQIFKIFYLGFSEKERERERGKNEKQNFIFLIIENRNDSVNGISVIF